MIAVEPQPALVTTLRLLCGGDQNVTVEAAAAEREAGIVEFNVNIDNPTVSTASSDFLAAATDARPFGKAKRGRRA